MTDTCKTCRFWAGREALRHGEQMGWCRRFPPTFVGLAEDYGEAIWLHTETPWMRWCGEHQPKDKSHE